MGVTKVALVSLTLLGGCVLDWERDAGVSCTGDCDCLALSGLYQCTCEGTDCSFDCSGGEFCVVEGCPECELDCGERGCCTQSDGQLVCVPSITSSCDTPCP